MTFIKLDLDVDVDTIAVDIAMRSSVKKTHKRLEKD